VRTFDELEAAYRMLPPPRGRLKLIVVRRSEGAHDTPLFARLDVAEGLEGDRWARGNRDPGSQLTLMNAGVAGVVAAGGPEPEHMAGDNLLVDFELGAVVAGTRIRVGEAVVEITAKPHTGCKKFSARFGQDALRWVNWHEHQDRRLRGVHARVVVAATVAVGDPVEMLPPATPDAVR